MKVKQESVTEFTKRITYLTVMDQACMFIGSTLGISSLNMTKCDNIDL